MNYTQKVILSLTSLIVVLSLISVLTALFYKTSGDSYEFLSLRGVTIIIQGSGLYQYDSKSMAAQAIAQDIVTLCIGIPLLIVSLVLFIKNSFRGQLLLTGTLGYFLYTYITYAFLAAYNFLFLVYTAIYSLTLFSFILTFRTIDVQNIPSKISEKFPRKSICVYLIFIALMVSALWLNRIIPSLIHGTVPEGLETYSTLVIQALDLGLVLPLSFISAILLLKRNAWGYLLTAVLLIKGFTLLLAISAMIIGQLNAGIQMSFAEIIMFPVFAIVNIILTILYLSRIAD